MKDRSRPVERIRQTLKQALENKNSPEINKKVALYKADMVLGKDQIEKLIRKDKIKNFPHKETQLHQKHFDLTVNKIYRYKSKGEIDFSYGELQKPKTSEIKPSKKEAEDKYGWWKLDSGRYQVITNEKLKIPEDITAEIQPKEELTQLGTNISNLKLKPEFEGQPILTLKVENPKGINVKENARIAKLILK